MARVIVRQAQASYVMSMTDLDFQPPRSTNNPSDHGETLSSDDQLQTSPLDIREKPLTINA